MTNEADLRKQLVELSRSLFDRGYSTGGGGNISLLLPDGHVLTTPTGSCLGRLNISTLSKVDLDGNLISGDKPSKEVAFHLEIYKNNTECRAIVHLHSTYLTALSCIKGLNKENALSPFTPYYVMRIGQLPVIDYFKPGAPQLAQEIGKKALYNAILLENHGSVVIGKNLIDAVNNAEELEETAKLFFILQNEKIKYLTSKEIDELKK